jgi:hypothetical protein
LGLGLLFLLVKRTELCQFEVKGARGRSELRIEGRFPKRSLEAVIAATGATPVAGAGSTAGVGDGKTTLIIPVPTTPAGKDSILPPEWAASGAVQLRLDDGRVFPVDSMGIVGREPHPEETGWRGVLVAVPDPTRSISKSHFAFGPHEAGLWVEDLASTNGTRVILPSGVSRQLQHGDKTPIGPGTIISFGDRSARVESI